MVCGCGCGFENDGNGGASNMSERCIDDDYVVAEAVAAVTATGQYGKTVRATNAMLQCIGMAISAALVAAVVALVIGGAAMEEVRALEVVCVSVCPCDRKEKGGYGDGGDVDGGDPEWCGESESNKEKGTKGCMENEKENETEEYWKAEIKV